MSNTTNNPDKSANNLPPKKEFTQYHMWRAFLFGKNIKAIQDVHGLNKSESEHFDFFIATIKKEEENEE